MIVTVLTVLNELILDLIKERDEVFLGEIEDEWDEGGCGSFPPYVVVRMREKWREMVRRN